MLLGQALILGIIQGLTEFLPISSSGHLIIIPELFSWADQGLYFDAWIHLGTLFAVILYFNKELKRIFLSFITIKKRSEKEWRKLGLLILLATIPAAIFGLLFNDTIATVLRNPSIVAISLIFWAGVMWIAEIYSEKYSSNQNDITKVGFWPAVAVGFWQVISLIPGTSRSGITMTGGMLAGLNKKNSIKFSFLLSIPIIAAAGIFSLFDMFQSDIVNFNWAFIVSGFLSSFIFGYIAIAFLLKIVERWGFRPFIVYRILLALIILFFL